MKIIVDECLSTSTITLKIPNHWEVIIINEILHFGVEDESIFEYASLHQIPIITHDRRFGYIYYNSIKNPPMPIILLISSPLLKETNRVLHSALSQKDLTSPNFQGKLIIIGKNKIRIRSQQNLK